MAIENISDWKALRNIRSRRCSFRAVLGSTGCDLALYNACYFKFEGFCSPWHVCCTRYGILWPRNSFLGSLEWHMLTDNCTHWRIWSKSHHSRPVLSHSFWYLQQVNRLTISNEWVLRQIVMIWWANQKSKVSDIFVPQSTRKYTYMILLVLHQTQFVNSVPVRLSVFIRFRFLYSINIPTMSLLSSSVAKVNGWSLVVKIAR